MGSSPERPLRLVEAKGGDRVVESGPGSLSLADFPFGGVGEHLVDHCLAATEVDGHLWAPADKVAMA